MYFKRQRIPAMILKIYHTKYRHSLINKEVEVYNLGGTYQASGTGLCDLCVFPVPVPCPSPHSRSDLCVFEMFPHLPNQKNLLGHNLYPALALCHDPCHGLFLHLQNDCYSCRELCIFVRF